MQRNSSVKYNYNDFDVCNAIAAVRNGTRIADAARQFGIPRQTLSTKIKTNTHVVLKPGPKPNHLPKDLEDELANWIVEGSILGDPKTYVHIKESAWKLALDNELDVFGENGPTIGWITRFVKRHPELSNRNAKYFSKLDFCGTVSSFDTEEQWPSINGLAHSINDQNLKFNDEDVDFATNTSRDEVLDDDHMITNCDERKPDQYGQDDDITTQKPESKHHIQYDLRDKEEPLTNTVDDMESQGSSPTSFNKTKASYSTESPYTAGLRILGPALIEEFDNPNFVEEMKCKWKLYEMYMMLKTKGKQTFKSSSLPPHEKVVQAGRMRPFGAENIQEKTKMKKRTIVMLKNRKMSKENARIQKKVIKIAPNAIPTIRRGRTDNVKRK